MIENCNNCKNLIECPRNNSYKDIDYLCAATSYFLSDINTDRHNIKRYTPGGKELMCDYQEKNKH